MLFSESSFTQKEKKAAAASWCLWPCQVRFLAQPAKRLKVKTKIIESRTPGLRNAAASVGRCNVGNVANVASVACNLDAHAMV